jgi:hypothetical protein
LTLSTENIYIGIYYANGGHENGNTNCEAF